MSVLYVSSGIALAQSPTNMPSAYVTDSADLFTPTEEEQLNSLIEQIEKRTTNEIAVVTVESLE